MRALCEVGKAARKWENQHKKLDFHSAGGTTEEYNSVWQPKCGDDSESLNN
jgi:hypothetical protein